MNFEKPPAFMNPGHWAHGRSGQTAPSKERGQDFVPQEMKHHTFADSLQLRSSLVPTPFYTMPHMTLVRYYINVV